MIGASKKFVCKDDLNFRWKNWTLSAGTTTAVTDSNASTNGAAILKTETTKCLHVSNDQCPPPQGLTVFQEFLSEKDAIQLYYEILDCEFSWEGFEQRRRVQRYKIPPKSHHHNEQQQGPHRPTNGNNSTVGDIETVSCSNDDNKQNGIPKTLFILMGRLSAATGHWPQHVSVEEYLPQQTLKITQYGSKGYNQIVTSFESTNAPPPCTCHENNGSNKEDESSDTQATKCSYCGSFVAEVPLWGGSIVKHLNKPKQRHNTCYDLLSTQHWTDIRLDERSLLMLTGDSLWNWRSRISALPPSMSPSSPPPSSSSIKQQQSKILSENNSSSIEIPPLLVLKLYNLPNGSLSSTANGAGSTTQGQSPPVSNNRLNSDYLNGINYDTFGYVGSPEANYRNTTMPPLEDILTIIVTTSPIKSNPSTEVLERSFETFRNGGSAFALKCQKVIVCDGFRVVDDDNSTEKVSRRHANAKQAMRSGICTLEQAENYNLFKAALRELCRNATSQSPFNNTVVEELDSRHGYGFALRHALRHCVKTPYVCVVQHDRTFMRLTPVEETLRAMWHHRHIKYVTMSMRSNLMYLDMFRGKYGKTYYEEFDDMIMRLPELNLDKSLYGPGSFSTQNVHYDNQKVEDSIKAIISTYKASKHNLHQEEWLENHPPIDTSKHQLTLTPTLFWYDNVHIAETEHYRDFVFNPVYKMVKKGGFVEDKLSPVLTRTLERLGLREGHSRFGCYILDDHSGLFFTGHFDGGAYVPKAQRGEQRKLYSGRDQ